MSLASGLPCDDKTLQILCFPQDLLLSPKRRPRYRPCSTASKDPPRLCTNCWRASPRDSRSAGSGGVGLVGFVGVWGVL